MSESAFAGKIFYLCYTALRVFKFNPAVLMSIRAGLEPRQYTNGS